MKLNLLKELVTLIKNDLYVTLLRVMWCWYVGPRGSVLQWSVRDPLRMHVAFQL